MCSASVNPQGCFKHVPVQALQALVCNCVLQVPPIQTSAPDCTCPWLHSYVKCVLSGAQSDTAAMQQCQSTQHLPEERHHYSILLFHYFKTLLPTGLATSTSMFVSYSETNRLPALHSFCSRQPLSIICFPFHSFTSHSLKVAVGLKSIHWLLGLCCWKQSVSLTCSRELARSRQLGRASSQEVGF